MTEFPFIGNGEHAYGPLDPIHSNVCGPLSINSRGCFVYFITFIEMIVHDLGTCILRDTILNPLKSSDNSEMK